jgi:gamma-glutamyltranspeptidase / glutathione hydrolase
MTQVAFGSRGIVATGHALATDAALDVLRAGGNAVDAAVCAALVLSVVCPYACTLGGDLFALVYDPRT